MTDNEIIKALECCSEPDKCGECPLISSVREHNKVCLDKLPRLALDLINRQKAEIERLKRENDELGDYLDSSWTHEGDMYNSLADERTEAIKEFAERLKEEKMDGGWDWGEIVSVEDIDNLVKEMTEQSNG